MLSLLVSSCTDDDVTGFGNVPLQVSVTANSPLVSRAIVTDEYLPDASEIGVSLFAADGSSYDGQNYSNVKYTAAGTGEAQTWTGAADVSLSGNPATVVAYYPWQEGVDLTAVPVETATQTDYMWAETLTGLSMADAKADIVMNHALTAVRVKLVLGDYTGSVDVSDISVSSPALGTAASLDVLGGEGALADITGQGEVFMVDADFDMTTTGKDTDLMMVPDGGVTSGKTVVAATIGGNKFSAGIAFSEAYKQGYIYTYVIKLNNTGFEVTKVAVTPWGDGGTQEGEFKFDNDYIVKVTVNNDTEFSHNVKEFVGTVDWGDGTIETFEEPTNWPKHTYTSGGVYTVTANGMMSSLSMLNNVLAQYITDLIYIGSECGVTSMYYAFASSNLKHIEKGALEGCTEVTDFGWAFYNCDNLQTIPGGLFDHCTEVTSFYGTFDDCENLQAIPNTIFRNCISAENFEGTFMGCTSLTSIPEGLFDDCTEALDFGGGCWYGTFRECTSLTSIPAGLFDACTEATTFMGIFYDCTSLKEIPEGLFDNNTKVTDFSYAFGYCAALQAIPYGLFDNCTEVTSFGSAFADCTSLMSVPYNLFKNLDYTDTSVFARCTGLEDYPNSNYWACYNFQTGNENIVGENCDLSGIQAAYVWVENYPYGSGAACVEVKGEDLKEILSDEMSDSWIAFEFVEKDGEITIPEGLFDASNPVIEFEFYKSDIKIADNAFKGCSTLQSLAFYDDITNLPGITENSLEGIAATGNVNVDCTEAVGTAFSNYPAWKTALAGWTWTFKSDGE